MSRLLRQACTVGSLPFCWTVRSAHVSSVPLQDPLKMNGGNFSSSTSLPSLPTGGPESSPKSIKQPHKPRPSLCSQCPDLQACLSSLPLASSTQQPPPASFNEANLDRDGLGHPVRVAPGLMISSEKTRWPWAFGGGGQGCRRPSGSQLDPSVSA